MGGDLSPERLLAAYRHGIFPWFSEDEPVLWWSPDPRTVFIPGQIRTSQRLARRIRQGGFALTLDRAFDEVMLRCAEPRRSGPETWLSPQMRQAYSRLHQLGFAHSIEVWQNGRLVGGLYGVALGRVFFGESMFSRATDMSKVALVILGQCLKDWGYLLLDGQVGSRHLYNMGAVDMPRLEFERLLEQAVPRNPQPSRWSAIKTLPSNPAHLPESFPEPA